MLKFPFQCIREKKRKELRVRVKEENRCLMVVYIERKREREREREDHLSFVARFSLSSQLSPGEYESVFTCGTARQQEKQVQLLHIHKPGSFIFSLFLSRHIAGRKRRKAKGKKELLHVRLRHGGGLIFSILIAFANGCRRLPLLSPFL